MEARSETVQAAAIEEITSAALVVRISEKGPAL
jgi:hypothetical protein